MSEDRGFTAKHNEKEDRHERGDRHDDEEEDRPRPPRAKLRIKNLTRDRDALNWIRLDARRSKARRGTIQSYTYEITVAGTGADVHGPGATTTPIAHVLLSPGSYVASVTVTDHRGARDTRTRRIRIRGKAAANFNPGRVQWAFDEDWRVGDAAITIAHVTGPVPLQEVMEIFAEEANEPPLLQTSGGCGSMKTNGSNGIKIATGFLSMIPEAGTALKVGIGVANATAAGLAMAGGHENGSCIQNQIDAINDQLAFQEQQIENLYSIINRDQEAFFSILSDLNNTVGELVQNDYNTVIEDIKTDFDGFMVAAGLWDPETNLPWKIGSGSDTTQISVSIPALAACEYSRAECCIPELYTSTCDNFLNPHGPFVITSAHTAPDTFSENIGTLTGSSLSVACQASNDCFKNINADSNTEPSTDLLTVYQYYAENLDQAVNICTSNDLDIRTHCPNKTADSQDPWDPSDCPSDGTCTASQTTPTSNNVVDLLDQYNDALGAKYLQSLYALQQAFSIEQIINRYNYESYKAANGVIIEQYGDVEGTYYYALMAHRFYRDTTTGQCVSSAPGPTTPRQHDDTFNCSQEHLALAYAKRLAILYNTTLGYLITDPPASPQAYPENALSPPPEWVPYSKGISWSINYESEVGRLLREFWDDPNTPIDLVSRVTGAHTTSPNGHNWTSDAALYQAYQLVDSVTCADTLKAWNSGGNNSDTDIANAFSSFDDCPSIFALPDDSAVNEGFYDGLTLQPYSFQVAPGGGGDCPALCEGAQCQNGQNPNDPDLDPMDPSYIPWTAGGQGLVGGQPLEACGSCYGADPTGCCNTCQDVIDAYDSLGWLVQTSDFAQCTGTCRGFCSGWNYCGDYRYAFGPNGASDYTDCTHCGGDPVLALSAPMHGNLFLCTNDGPPAGSSESTTPCAASEGDVCACDVGDDVYYGKKFVNSLGLTGSVPGFGTVASFDEMISDAAYFKVAAVTGGVTCSNDQLGDPAPYYSKQCYCAPSGNQMTWYRSLKSDFVDPDKAALQPQLSYLSCGNYAVRTGPQTVEEYIHGSGCSDGCNDATGDDALPPTKYRDTRTTATQTFENGHGQLDSTATGQGVYWEVAFGNVDTQCNDAGPTYVFATMYSPESPDDPSSCVVPVPSDSQNQLSDRFGEHIELGSFSNGWYDATVQLNPVDPPPTDTEQWCRAAKFSPIDNNDNGTFYVFPFQVRPPNAATGHVAGGPRIPIDLVMQCSDNGSGFTDCEDQSTCMHLVTFKPGGAENDLAERGFSCTEVHSQPSLDDEPLYPVLGRLECSLQDGRKYYIDLSKREVGSDDDGRAAINVWEVNRTPTLCASADYDWCSCAGTVYYGKKYVNSLGTNGEAPGYGPITTFEQMRSDPGTSLSWPNVQAPGLWCEPDTFGGTDPAGGFYKHCYCEATEPPT